MSLMVAIYTSQGLIARCDARCYDAPEGSCDCLCRGVNHGKGLDAALANVRRDGDRMIQSFVDARGICHFRARLACDPAQLTLFPVPPEESPRERGRA